MCVGGKSRPLTGMKCMPNEHVMAHHLVGNGFGFEMAKFSCSVMKLIDLVAIVFAFVARHVSTCAIW